MKLIEEKKQEEKRQEEKKQEEKKPEKKELEGLPKKNMDDLRKMVILPGMGQKAAPATPKKQVTVDDEPVENKSNQVSIRPDDHSEIEEKQHEPLQIRLPPQGINFALEAVKIRQAQLGKVPMSREQSSNLLDEPTGRASVRMSGRLDPGKLDHSAALSKPKMAGRRAPKVQQVGKLLPKAEIDKTTHENTFKVLITGLTSSDKLIVHATSQFERDHWVHTINANIYMLNLKHDLEQAQKRDMMSALQAQIKLEQFLSDNTVTYSGFLEKLSMKSQRNWKKRWFELTEKGELRYFENENSKKPKQVLQLSYLTVVTSADGERLDAPLVIKTGIEDVTTGEESVLPQNIAIFDNENVTIDLSVIVDQEFGSHDLQPVEESREISISAPVAVEEEFVMVENETQQSNDNSQLFDDKPLEVKKDEVLTEPVVIEETSFESIEPLEEVKPIVIEMNTSVEADQIEQVEKKLSNQDIDLTTKINDAWSRPGATPDRLPSSRVASSDAKNKTGMAIVDQSGQLLDDNETPKKQLKVKKSSSGRSLKKTGCIVM